MNDIWGGVYIGAISKDKKTIFASLGHSLNSFILHLEGSQSRIGQIAYPLNQSNELQYRKRILDPISCPYDPNVFLTKKKLMKMVWRRLKRNHNGVFIIYRIKF